MLRTPKTWFLPTTITLGLALGWPALAPGQGASLSSGSGAGTGTGTGAGASTFAPGTGEMTGPGSVRPGMGLGGPRPNMGFEGLPGYGPFISPLGPPGGSRGMLQPIRPPYPPEAPLGAPFGEGSRSRLPNDPTMPLEALPGSDNSGLMSPDEIDRADAEMLSRARAIADPAERSLALDRVAQSKIFAREYRDAATALEEAGRAALEMPNGLLRDLRIMGVVTSINELASEEVRQATLARETFFDDFSTSLPFNEPTAEEKAAAAERARAERERQGQFKGYWLQDAQYLYRFAATLARSMANTNYRAETLYRVVGSQALGSQEIAQAAARLDPSATDVALPRRDLEELADRALLWADGHARAIEITGWRDQALESIVLAAAGSDQYSRALEIARTIPSAEHRAMSLGRVADAQARRGRSEDATKSYNEAVRALAAIPRPDVRDVLTGLLLDSLITVGRFDDARATVGMYRDPKQQLIALGAVAQSQGQRGQAEEARTWINRDVSPQYRSRLLRRVEEGVLLTVNSSRSQYLGSPRAMSPSIAPPLNRSIAPGAPPATPGANR